MIRLSVVLEVWNNTRMKSIQISSILLLLGSIGIQSHSLENREHDFAYKTENVEVNFNTFNETTVYTVKKFDRVMQRVYLSEVFEKSDLVDGFKVNNTNQEITFKITENSEDPNFTLITVSRTLRADQRAMDCFDLATGHLHWFGGPQIFKQYWPIEKLQLDHYSYVTKQEDNVGVAERFWLHSKGGFIYVDDKAPLFISQNVNGNKLCLIVENTLPYNTRREAYEFVYHLGLAENSKLAQNKGVELFLNKPSAMPDRRMVEHPIWSTWARFKKDVNEKNVDEFAADIAKYGFNNSQFEIDDDWEKCYGALEFRDSKFPSIRGTTDDLHARGYRVTLWVHPFINKGCEPYYSHAKEHGYLVVDHLANSDTHWWDSKENEAAHIDFTNPEAADWYEQRLRKLQIEAGIDSYKFDAGETSYLPKDPKLNATADDHPSALLKAYLRTVAKFGPIIEVRTAQGTQDLPIFLRMLDKDTEWTFSNGLPTLITTLLQLNTVGYGFILPDMIGGNGYNHKPSKELFIRWLQANVFMPSLQFSYVPWEYDDETVEISKTFTALHAEYTDEIMDAFSKHVSTGELVNAPIFWLDPYDEVALTVDDEFLLGGRILSAPVTKEGDDYRHIYLPKGQWFDPNQQKKYTGPIWLMDYPAPLNVLPYFIRQ